MLSFDETTKRSDPNGLLVRFEVGSGLPIMRIDLDLVGDGEAAIITSFEVGPGFDGRYIRAMAFKPVANGTWPLSLTAWDTAGRMGTMVCSPGVTVIF